MAKALTAKQEAFCLAYLETGNASEAYRRSYNAVRMMARTVEKRAGDLLKNGAVTGRIAELQAKAAEKAVLDRAWVLERLMRNVRVAMGEEAIRLKVKSTNRKTKRVTVIEIEVSDRDAAAANQALALLGKTDEVRLFVDRLETTGRNGAPLVPEANSRDLARAVLSILRQAHVATAEPDNAEAGDSGLSASTAGLDLRPAATPSPASPRIRRFNRQTGKLE